MVSAEGFSTWRLCDVCRKEARILCVYVCVCLGRKNKYLGIKFVQSVE